MNEGIVQGLIKTLLREGRTKEEIFNIPIIKENLHMCERAFNRLTIQANATRKLKLNPFDRKITFRISKERRRQLWDYALSQKNKGKVRISHLVRQIIEEKLDSLIKLRVISDISPVDKIKEINSEVTIGKKAD